MNKLIVIQEKQKELGLDYSQVKIYIDVQEHLDTIQVQAYINEDKLRLKVTSNLNKELHNFVIEEAKKFIENKVIDIVLLKKLVALFETVKNNNAKFYINEDKKLKLKIVEYKQKEQTNDYFSDLLKDNKKYEDMFEKFNKDETFKNLMNIFNQKKK